MSEKWIAPWTPEQVEALRKRQTEGWAHPYTCGQRDGHPIDPEGDHGVLVPTEDGWVCRHCDYTQNWAHAAPLTGAEYYLTHRLLDPAYRAAYDEERIRLDEEPSC